MNPVFAAALELQSFCRSRSWRFCFIGGLVVARWGEPRTTADADLTLLTGFGAEADYVDALLGAFAGRTPGARALALERRVLLLQARNTVALDVSLAAFPFEERVIARSSDFDLGSGILLRTCGAEDLVVMKAFAGRDLDWGDVAGIAIRQAGRLDEALIFRELEPLLEVKGTPEAADRLRDILRRAAVGQP